MHHDTRHPWGYDDDDETIRRSFIAAQSVVAGLATRSPPTCAESVHVFPHSDVKAVGHTGTYRSNQASHDNNALKPSPYCHRKDICRCNPNAITVESALLDPPPCLQSAHASSGS